MTGRHATLPLLDALRDTPVVYLQTPATLTGDRFVRGVVLFTGETAVPFGANLHALPVAQLWA